MNTKKEEANGENALKLPLKKSLTSLFEETQKRNKI